MSSGVSPSAAALVSRTSRETWDMACLLGALRLAGGFALALSLPLVCECDT
jgi:hypothetical protein